MNWFSIDMPQRSLADGAYHRLCRAFQRAFINAGAPSDLALFAVRPAGAVRRLYLTPSSDRYVPELVRRHNGRCCEVPAASTVTLVYGVPGAASLLRCGDEQAVEQEQATQTSIVRLLSSSRTAATR